MMLPMKASALLHVTGPGREWGRDEYVRKMGKYVREKVGYRDASACEKKVNFSPSFLGRLGKVFCCEVSL